MIKVSVELNLTDVLHRIANAQEVLWMSASGRGKLLPPGRFRPRAMAVGYVNAFAHLSARNIRRSERQLLDRELGQLSRFARSTDSLGLARGACPERVSASNAIPEGAIVQATLAMPSLRCDGAERCY
jgi:hypothetical protein